ncbi:DMT family transporter [Sporosarcina sp. P19]|uniref:DMT family transporter n=1 Tax=Sporosarcina sp. P19 TaxID=2048258 RepID=UPI001E4696D6|nr:DMT family transporter [Sporosarcina sp. P19]
MGDDCLSNAIWFYLLQTRNPERTSAFLFLAPFFGTLSGWVLLEETLSMSFILGGTLISLGILFVNWRSKRVLNRGLVDLP